MKLLCFVMLLASFRLPFVQAWLGRFALLPHYMNFVDKFLASRAWYGGNFGLAVAVGSFAVILNVLALACGNGLLGFVFQSAVLIFAVHAITPIEFSALNAEFLPNHVDQGALKQLPAKVWEANYRIVSPLFWYMFFGVLGVTAYAMLAYLQQNSRWQNLARAWLETLSWVPARILSFAYAVAGNFSQGLKVIGEFFGAGIQYNQYLLQSCVLASVIRKSDESIQVNVERLARDALILLAGLYALVAMLGWLII